MIILELSKGGKEKMKLATRINSYLRIEGYDLEKTFSDFKKVGLGYVKMDPVKWTR